MTKVLFIGTSEFAVPTLEYLIENANYNVVGLVTQPDRPVGRKQIMTPPDTKRFIQNTKENIDIFQPDKLKDESSEILEKTQPELVLVASYGQMIPDDILNFPKYKALNIHASVLPHLRGAVPIPMAILQGLDKTGVTLQIMEKELDAGDIIGIKELNLEGDETTESLTVKASQKAVVLLDEILKEWINGNIEPIKQDDSKATYCYMKDIAKKNAQILASHNALQADRMARAFYPWPIAWFRLKKEGDFENRDEAEANSKFAAQRLKIYKSRVAHPDDFTGKGLKLYRGEDSLYLRMDYGWLEILECQLPGKKRLSSKDYLYLANDTTTSVRGIVIYNNTVLLIKRIKKGNEYYIFPGGAVGVNESEHEAVIREIKEESGVDASVDEYLLEYVEKIGSLDYKHRYYICNAEDVPDKLTMSAEEQQISNTENYYEPVWIEIENLDDKDVHCPDEVLEFIKEY